MRRPLVILLLLVAVPSAAACSFAGPVPGPAKITLVPDDGGAERVIAIDGRMSGAGCELSNPHMLVEGTFVWLEYFFNPTRREVHLLDVDRGEERVVELAHPDMDGFGYWNGAVLYRARDFSDELPPADTFVAQRVEGGAPETLPFPPGHYVSAAFAGPHVAAVRVEGGGYDGRQTFYLYDHDRREWLAEGVPAQELVNASRLRLGPMGSGWLYLFAQDRPILYDVSNGTALARYDRGATEMAPKLQHPMTIVDGHAYGWGREHGAIQRMRLPEGPLEDVPVQPGFIGKVAGYTVYGEYSAPELDWWWRFRGLGDAAPWIVAGALVLLAPAAWLLRRRG